ncbi:hypothetical protein DOT79_20685 [Ralstonia pseudosolanacearum]|nr:hypothetical protein DOT79_20685 [Ralstonia pseudosolanacearum]
MNLGQEHFALCSAGLIDLVNGALNKLTPSEHVAFAKSFRDFSGVNNLATQFYQCVYRFKHIFLCYGEMNRNDGDIDLLIWIVYPGKSQKMLNLPSFCRVHAELVFIITDSLESHMVNPQCSPARCDSQLPGRAFLK